MHSRAETHSTSLWEGARTRHPHCRQMFLKPLMSPHITLSVVLSTPHGTYPMICKAKPMCSTYDPVPAVQCGSWRGAGVEIRQVEVISRPRDVSSLGVLLGSHSRSRHIATLPVTDGPTAMDAALLLVSPRWWAKVHRYQFSMSSDNIHRGAPWDACASLEVWRSHGVATWLGSPIILILRAEYRESLGSPVRVLGLGHGAPATYMP